MGINPHISKVKGSAETYGMKYFLTKFFMMPTTENEDPDKLNNNQISNKPLTKEEQKQVDDLLKRHGLDEDIKISTATDKKISVGNYQPTYRCVICKSSLVFRPESQKY